MALAGSDTSSLIEVLEGAFGCIDFDTASTISADDIPVQKPVTPQMPTEEKLPEKMPTTSSGESSLAIAELVFPLKSLSQVITAIQNHFYLFVALRLSFATHVNIHPVMRSFLRKQWPATMCDVIIYMWLWLASVALPTIPQKCSGTVHLHGSITPVNTCKTTSQFILMTLLFMTSLVKLIFSPLPPN